MFDPAEEEEWRGLIQRLHSGQEPVSPPDGKTPIYEEPPARSRVGVVIAKAMLGNDLYELYRLYCGDPSPR